ncbi:MAG: adenylate/guanylate cyclase domain-containing protein [Syntrophobacteraceae bacterium]
MKFLKSNAIIGLVICALVCAGVWLARRAGALESSEFAVYGCYLQRQSPMSIPDNRIVLVTISESDISQLKSWPLNDGLFAKMIENLLAHGPRVVGVDIFRNIEVPPGSDKLKELFSKDIPVVSVMKFGDEISPGVDAPFMVKDNSLVGFGDALVDSGGITRRGLLFMDNGKVSSSSFSLLLATVYLQEEGIRALPDPANPQLMKLGKTTFAPLESDAGAYVGMDSRGYQFLLNFAGIKAGFASIPLCQVLAGNFADEAVRGKIVIIGATAESLRDFFFVPFTRSAEQGQRVWGVELRATVVSQLLHAAIEGQEPMGYWPERAGLGWTIMWGLIGYLICLKVPSFRRFAILLLLLPVLLAGITFLMFIDGVWVPVIPPFLAFAASADFFRLYLLSVERRQRAQLMRLFESCVSKDIAKTIWSQRQQFMEGGLPRPQNLTATVLFTDLQGFSTISERFGDPGHLMNWLNEYMEAMTCTVTDNGGVINKYIGDAVMAIFGVPVARTDEKGISEDAVNAVRCAMEMGNRLEDLNIRWEDQQRPTVRMRVGIFTGPLVVGCIGSKHRLEYTVTGDSVNVASRLESFDKTLDAGNTCRILIGKSTWEYARKQFMCRGLGEGMLKGKDQRIEIYQVLGKLTENEAAVPQIDAGASVTG